MSRRSRLSPDPIAVLRQELAIAGSQTALAAALALSKQYVSDLLAYKRTPGPKVLRALGFEMRWVRRRKKHLTADSGQA